MEKYLKSFDGTRLCYYVGGKRKGPVLVFLHGWLGNKTHWKNHFKHFEKKGYFVLAIDVRGFGKSDAPKKKPAYSFENSALDVDLILNAEKIKSATILGYSMGGMIALTFIDLFPKRVERLVLAMSGYKGPSKNSVLKERLNRFANLSKYHSSERDKRTEIDFSRSGYFTSSYEATVKDTTPLCVLASLESIVNFDGRSILPKISVPTLVIAGKTDKLMPLSQSRYIKSKIKKSKIVLVNRGHTFPVTDPAQSIKIIEGFLQDE